MTKIDEIRKRCENASPGPWIVRNDNDGTEYMPFWVISNSEESDEWFAELHVGYREDAEFIANARQDIPFLLSQVDRSRKALGAKDTNTPTNFDRITASKEALAEALGLSTPCRMCAHSADGSCKGECQSGFIDWCNQPAEAGGEAE